MTSLSTVVTGSAVLRWTDAKHRVLLFFHGDESLEHVHRDHEVPISTLAWQILQMTKVFLPLGLWASLRHHDLFALLPGACSRVRQSLHYDLLQEYFSTFFYSRNTFKSSSFFRPRGVCGGHYLCPSAKPLGTLPMRTSSTYGRRPGQPSSSSLARRVCVQSPTTSSFLSSSTSSRTSRSMKRPLVPIVGQRRDGGTVVLTGSAPSESLL